MSIRATQQIDSYGRLPSVSDKDIRIKEAKTTYYRILIFIIIDFILSVLIILQKYNIFREENNMYLFLIIDLSITTIFFILISILLSFLRPLLSIVIKYIYIVLGISYYILNITSQIMYFIDNYSDVYWVDYLFSILILGSITPRIFFWHYADLFIPQVKLIADCKDGEDHDKLLQKVENKMDRGDTEWSYAGKSERQTNFITRVTNRKFNQSDKFKYSIRENYIKEEEIKNEEDNLKEENNIENENKNEDGKEGGN